MRYASVLLLLAVIPGVTLAQDKPRVVLERVTPAFGKPVADPGDPAPEKSATGEDAKPEPIDIKPAADAKADKIKPPRVPEFIGDQAPIGSLRRLPSGQIL